MYAVVGCSECGALWVVEGRPETTQCPRCGARRDHARRKKFFTSEDADAAREARASLLADRQDLDDAFASVDSFGTLEDRVEDSGVDDETYLEGSGLDAEAVAEAGERAGQSGGGSRSNEEIVREALRTLDGPTADEVLGYAGEHDVDGARAERLLEKLVRSGEVSESRGTYRLL